jgi:hypothetical protein
LDLRLREVPIFEKEKDIGVEVGTSKTVSVDF